MNVCGIGKAIVEGNLLEKIYQKVKRLLITDTFNGENRRRIFKRLDCCFASIVRREISRRTEIVENKILFITTRGSYNCNLRAIADEIIRQKAPWKLVWVARKEDMKKSEQFPPELKIVIRDSYECFIEMASAKVWIDNSINLQYLYIPKKNDQILIEAWHGSFGLKRFETSSDRVWLKKARHAGDRTDYCISNSEFESEIFKSTFWATSEMLPYGYPRNDLLLATESERAIRIKQRLRSELKLTEDVHVALYAPTYRDDRSLSYYQIDYDQLHNSLTERFGGDWVILVRFHFEVLKRLKKMKRNVSFPEFVYDVSSFPDIQDILSITDVGITDYSSWICDYLLTRRPAFFYVTDLRDFYNERGFYYPLDDTPIPLAQSNYELMLNIKNFNEVKYKRSCDEFLQDKGCFEDGHAAERVVAKLKELIDDQGVGV